VQLGPSNAALRLDVSGGSDPIDVEWRLTRPGAIPVVVQSGANRLYTFSPTTLGVYELRATASQSGSGLVPVADTVRFDVRAAPVTGITPVVHPGPGQIIVNGHRLTVRVAGPSGTKQVAAMIAGAAVRVGTGADPDVVGSATTNTTGTAIFEDVKPTATGGLVAIASKKGCSATPVAFGMPVSDHTVTITMTCS
jgi:hypothetical protein